MDGDEVEIPSGIAEFLGGIACMYLYLKNE